MQADAKNHSALPLKNWALCAATFRWHCSRRAHSALCFGAYVRGMGDSTTKVVGASAAALLKAEACRAAPASVCQKNPACCRPPPQSQQAAVPSELPLPPAPPSLVHSASRLRRASRLLCRRRRRCQLQRRPILGQLPVACPLGPQPRPQHVVRRRDAKHKGPGASGVQQVAGDGDADESGNGGGGVADAEDDARVPGRDVQVAGAHADCKVGARMWGRGEE